VTNGTKGNDGTELALTVNGEPLFLPAASTIADVVKHLLGPSGAKGVAVAVDRTVVPRSAWAATQAETGSHIEIVTAAAGG
jgi:sulfur carrier protein